MTSPQKGTFFQPLNIDSEWQDTDWAPRLATLTELRIDVLFLQWTRHDTSRFGEPNGWLWQLMQQASEQEFELILGLYAEPAFFAHVNTTFDAQYWAGYMAKNLAWGKYLGARLRAHPRINAVGFYFPGELNDQVLADPATVALVTEDLQTLQRALGRPLYVSVYFTGNSTAAEYRQMLPRLRSENVHVLHQDGAGTRALNKNQVDEVLAELNCEFGVIHELFVQRSLNGFDALNEELVEQKISQTGCPQQVFFSWRYITPW
ncbi:DUF4434 domain-containing protein [Aliidiomarina sp. Khilg15.8]